MIESIVISGIATYAIEPEVLNGLAQFNYLFGSNGTGKTTVSRVIADENSFPTCKVTWKAGTKLQAMVYNHDFVERNFTQSTELKGVFTLGERQVDTLAKIAATTGERDRLTSKIENLTEAIQGQDGTGGKKGELTTLEAGLREKCWTLKQRLDDTHAQSALKGYMGSKESFKSKVLQELAGNAVVLHTLEELEKKAESIFGQTPTTEQVVPEVEVAKLISHESNPILKKRVVGKDDVDIAAMIKKLGNSDWVREGRTFYYENGSACPFCQQNTTQAFAKSLREYFDETFVTDSKAIDDLATNYSTDAGRIQQLITLITTTPSRFLDVEKLKAEKELLDSKVIINVQRLAGKKKEASQVVALESLNNVFATIKALIDSANAEVAAHNKMVANLAQERRTLTSQVWRYVQQYLHVDLASYKTTKEGLDKAIAAIKSQIETATTDRAKKVDEIRILEKQTTSVQPTIDAINAMLSDFGFQSFSLAKTANGTSYKLIRLDGSDAKATLSEGEKSFVTFLYFYHLLKGSVSDSGMTTDRVVVFDDPVSSLDSDILFIVGSLIKGLFEDVRKDNSQIKQVFVLTHNVYFHKEVTFSSPKKGVSGNEKAFWIVRKPGLVSKLEKCSSNPIKTSYELLWTEVRRSDRSNLAIQNTLRRILENHFKILGGLEVNDLHEMFEGREKIMCQSLCSWVHDGSHFAHDDLYVSIDDSMVENYLKVFRAIFVKSNHLEHYRMMMGHAFVEEPASNVDV